jgi:hypothetical protein
MGGAGWARAEGDAGGRLLLTGRGVVGGGGCVPRARRVRTFDLFETHAWKHFLWLLDNMAHMEEASITFFQVSLLRECRPCLTHAAVPA